MVPDALKSVSAVAIASLALMLGVRLGLQQSEMGRRPGYLRKSDPPPSDRAESRGFQR